MATRHDGWKRRVCGVLVVLAGIMSLEEGALAKPPRAGHPRYRSFAASPVDEAKGEAERPLRWYGWQIFVADGSATSLVMLGVALTDGEPPIALALPFYISPFVHALHGNLGRAAGSLGLRALLPLAGGLIGMESSDCGLLGGECKGLEVGLALGFASAMFIDASLLAWEVDDAPDAAGRRLRPALQIGRNGALLGVAGTL